MKNPMMKNNMNMLTLNPELKDVISRDVKLPFSKVEEMSAEEIDSHIEKTVGKKLRLGFDIGNICSRGSVYISAKRFIGLDKSGNITYDYEKM
ncbi:MAG: hypothetical protein J6K91_05970 [Opitutales bacterium]|nr:hypothetical protein [Opitutales bacterium]MBP3358442.1 hypothetical protein [Opitutales bacterium]